MVSALVVDDEIHSTEGIKYALDWDGLGIANIYTANNINQAQKVLMEHPVNIMVTDIEMPKGSGYDLLRWMRDNDYDPVVIILTSYGTFEYAKQAVEFRCIDYLLKPISPKALLKAVQKALGEHFSRLSQDANHQLAEYWNSDWERRLQYFWWDLIYRSLVATDSKSILGHAAQLHIHYTEQSIFIPSLFKYNNLGQPPFNGWVAELRNCLLSQLPQQSNAMLLQRDPYFWVIIETPQEEIQACMAKMQKISKELIDWGFSFSCYIGGAGDVEETTLQFPRLMSASQDNVAAYPEILPLSQHINTVIYERPNIDAWIQAFSRGNYSAAFNEVDSYLERLAHLRRIDRHSLRQLLEDYMQAFYVAFSEKNLQAHLLVSDQKSMMLYQRATESIPNFKDWLHHIISKANEYIAITSDANSIVGKIKLYIKEHLSEDLSRQNIAESIFLSVDYASRLFRKETGIQLSEYITVKRMEEACRLLETTDYQIGEVAYRTGYENLAYFSKVFRIRNGVTPASYRAEHRND